LAGLIRKVKLVTQGPAGTWSSQLGTACCGGEFAMLYPALAWVGETNGSDMWWPAKRKEAGRTDGAGQEPSAGCIDQA
jgi:hypothetical protein